MDNWHTAQCTKPDVAICPGLNVPACMSCGEICSSDRPDNKHNDDLQIPSAGKRSAMQLNWPPSMSYQSYAYCEDPDGSLHKALVSLIDQEWYDKTPDKHTPCSSIIKTAQAPSSQLSKTSYQSLDGTRIRVLRLRRGHFGDCLHGDFETVRLRSQNAHQGEPEIVSEGNNTPASYEAVSYTWAKGNGKREKDHAIFIGNRWDILPITENCFDALQNCRLDDQDIRLWVDAICINQSDTSERTHQVGMMREIYSTASRVLIYLENGDEESGSAVTIDPEILSRNSYFSRIWVVQEIASAKQALVLCARKAMHWSLFHSTLKDSSSRWMRHFGSPRQIDDANEFLTLLGDTRDCNASDPRDKIFALLGLWKQPVEPDYTLSPQAVYTGLSSILVTDKSQEVAGRLLHMASQGRSMLGLPSWVPDWSVKSRQPYQRLWNSPFSLPIKVPSNLDTRFRVHRQTGSLCVLAAEIDILAPYLSYESRPVNNGMITAQAGCISLLLASEVLCKCEPNDSIFYLSEYRFCLILRKKADPNAYSLIGLCEYRYLPRSQPQTTELDAIRCLREWAWLLSLGEERFWSEFATWGTAQICWVALRRQRKLETRRLLQRVVKKAHFLKRSRDLAMEERHVLEDYSKDKDRLREFFQRQWMKNYKRWQQADELLVVDYQERRALFRKLLPGYKSLEPLQGMSTQPPLAQSMWLPMSFSWFRGPYQSSDPGMDVPDNLYAQYLMLAACASRSIPLPPLHLITDPKRHIPLSLSLGLENGLRQLQRLALEHFPEEPLPSKNLVHYSPEISYHLDLKEEEWDIFLHWLSRPISPSYDMLRRGLKVDAPLIWELGLAAQTQLEQAHTWLDNNFDHHMETAYSSTSTEPSLDKFFGLIYREQFELLWLFIFRPGSTHIKGSHRVTLENIGAGFSGAFFWRFDRSISKACRAVGRSLPTQQEIEEQWNRFLGWLRQQPFEEPVRNIPSEVYDERPRLLVEEERSGEHHGNYCLEKIKYDGLFIQPKMSEPLPEWFRHAKPHKMLQPRTFDGEQKLGELIYSEIKQRRLPERVFAFLFDDAEANSQPTTSECTDLGEVSTRDQLSICGEPFTQRWSQETKSWKVVEHYIWKSQWYMSSVKIDLLRRSKEDGEWFREIVII
ncbi:hypothetical protein FGADI_7680 [Fusarium gaditjirri]|uniref:Heterokaryon incompatibility domain-containing protein n=1 Tax=Fusarium gaditjirri TaxID=282569 RepID=A0A8H4T4L1_9HYPO|nr:hypothetical protein FGADI_7680 [Fusarium gaditjirri]